MKKQSQMYLLGGKGHSQLANLIWASFLFESIKLQGLISIKNEGKTKRTYCYICRLDRIKTR